MSARKVPTGADGLLRLLTTIPGRREEALAIVNGLFGDALAERAPSSRDPDDPALGIPSGPS